jgi:hypothetical protein
MPSIVQWIIKERKIMSLQQRFITNSEIEQLAIEAVKNYELSCAWRNAGQEARECGADDFGLRLTNAQVATIVNVAKQKWEAIVMSTILKKIENSS